MAVGLGCGDMEVCPTLWLQRAGFWGGRDKSTGGEMGLLAPLLGCSECGRGMNCREKGHLFLVGCVHGRMWCCCRGSSLGHLLCPGVSAVGAHCR